jgi:threonine dehydrogenase-like Zn-dependent dehydrogenase
MQGYAFRIPAPGRVELQPFHDDSALPDDYIEGPAVVSAASPGTELASAYSRQDPTKPPSGTGYAMVFRVATAGPASGFVPGELAFAMANHQSWVRYPGRSAYHVPEGVAPEEAALARLANVSWSTLTTTTARPPARVAVTGLGIVGNLAAQIFAAAGYRVLACDPLVERRELLAGRGIELAERLPLEDPAWVGHTELVVECSGHEAAVLDACRLVARGGEVSLVGVPWVKRADLSAFDLLEPVFFRYVRLRSGWEWEVPMEPSDFRHGAIREQIITAMTWFASGRLSIAGLARRADPRDCDEVYRELKEQRAGSLTVLWDWSLVNDV